MGQRFPIVDDSSDQREKLATGLEMARSGALVEIWSHPPSEQASDSDAVVGLLKQLKELLDAGVLTEAEFQEKKAQLLARLGT